MRLKRFKRVRGFAGKAGAAAVVALAALPTPAPAQNPLDMLGDAAGNAGVPQIPAFLPDKNSVPETEPLPIDGVWMISSIGKRIRIDRGRAYAVDPWLHFFVLKVQPDMVVLQNFRRNGVAGRFTADDLPLQGPATFQLQPNGNLKASVQGVLGPANYDLIRREPTFPDALNTEIAAMTGDSDTPPPATYPVPPPGQGNPSPPPVAQPTPPPGAPPAPVPAPGGDELADCRNLGVDPNTADIVCMD